MSVALVVVLAVLGALHAAWGLGSRWPAGTEADLVARVIGRTRTGKMPSAGACFVVATGLFFMAWLAAIVTPESPAWLRAGYYGAAGVFLMRGFAGFVGPLWRYALDTPFHRFNRIYYSPLCLAIAALFILKGVTENVR